MKTTFKRYTIAALAIVTIVFISCEDADDNGNRINPNNSAYDLTETNSDLSILNTALIQTGLKSTLDSQGSTYTVFAPNNAAFNQYFTANGYANIEAVPIAELRAILLYHVLNFEVTSALLVTGYVKTLGKDEEVEALDLFIEVTTASSVVLNGSAQVAEADVNVGNGVVHIIDGVLDLPTIAVLIAANPEFDNLNTALVSTTLDVNLSNTDGSMSDPFTVFAPDNSAFDQLVNINPTDGLNTVADVLALSNLNEILLYHVRGSDRIRFGDISNGFVVTPLFGADYTINTMSGVEFIDGSMTTVSITTPTDVTAVNGIIHTIDIVARPM